MQVQHGDVDIVQQLAVELDSIAGGEEHNDFLFAILLQEGEQEQEALVACAHHIALSVVQSYIKIVVVIACHSRRSPAPDPLQSRPAHRRSRPSTQESLKRMTGEREEGGSQQDLQREQAER